MNELLTELLTLIDQNVIRIQPYTLDDSQRPAIEARIIDWMQRARTADFAIRQERVRDGAMEDLPYIRLKAATDWLARRCELDQSQNAGIFSKIFATADRDAILTLLRSFGRGQTPLEAPDPQHCYLCDRPKLDCACTLEESESPI